jgi:Glycosyltransferase 61
MAGIKSLAELAQDRQQTGVELLSIVAPEAPYGIPVPGVHYAGEEAAKNKAWEDLFISHVDALAPGVAVYRLGECFITPNSAVMTFSGDVVKESLYPYVNRADVIAAFAPYIRPSQTAASTHVYMEVRNTTVVREPVFYGRDHGESGYFHWAHSVLPRARAYRDIGLSRVKLNVALGSPLHAASLERVGWGPGQLFVADGNTLICKEMIMCTPMVVPDLNRSGGFFERSLYSNTTLRNLSSPAEQSGGKRLFISRRDSAVRRLVNESDVIERLKEHGFEVCVLSGMSFDDQINLFANAEMVVSMHGAGLSNVAFMRKDTAVLEILSPDRLWPTYRGVAARSEVRYFPYVGDRAGVVLSNDSDIHLDVAHFGNFVGAALEC